MSTCTVTIEDGTNTVVIENVPQQDVDYGPISGGGSILRYRDGTAEKQQTWAKERITITGQDREPKGLRGLLFDRLLTVTIATPLGTDVYTGYSLGVNESWGMTSGKVGWSIVVEEN